MAKVQGKLNVAVLKREHKKFDETILITTKGYTLNLDANFRNTKISNLILELMRQYTYSKSIEFDIDSIMSNYIVMLVLKHFSSLDIPEEFEQQIVVMEMLVDGEFLEEIYNQIPEGQVDKVVERFRLALKRIQDGFGVDEAAELTNEPISESIVE